MWISVRSFFNDQAIGVGRIILLFVINFHCHLALTWKLALASIVVVPVILIVSMWFFQKVTKAYEAYQEQEAMLSTTLQENLTGVRVVKAFARQDYEMDKFEKDNWEKFLRGKKLTADAFAFLATLGYCLRFPDAGWIHLCRHPCHSR